MKRPNNHFPSDPQALKFIAHWLNTIAIKAPKATFILIGTHKDELSDKRGALIRQFVLVGADEDEGGLGGVYGNGVEPVRNKLERLRIGEEVVIGPLHSDLQR